MNINFERTDFTHRASLASKEDIVVEKVDVDHFYEIITFSKHFSQKEFIKTLTREFTEFYRLKNLPSPFHVLIIGIGNDSHTADSLGPKVVKKIHVNAHLVDFDIHIEGNKISALEPGVLGETGIETRRIIESVAEEIDPDLVILIDSLVTDHVEDLAHTIVLTDEGLTPGSGLKGLNCEINENTLKKPVLTIGLATALEIVLPKEKEGTIPYLMSPSSIDTFVMEMSSLIAKSLDASLLTSEKD